MGEFGTDLLRAMNQRDAWLLYPEMAAGMDGIPNHFNALLKRRAGNNRCIGEKEQFIVRGYLHHGQMGQNLSFRQQAMLLVQNGTQQIVGIDDAFHQDVRSTLAYDTHRLTCRLIGIFYMQSADILRIFLQGGIFFQYGRIANHQKFRNPLLGTRYGILCIRVIGTDYCNAFPLIQGFQVGC